MEKLIIILLLLIIFLLLSEKFSLKIERKKYSKPLPESQKTPEKPKQNTSIMGKSKFVPPKQENPLTEAEKRAILAEFEQKNENYLPDFEDEEEDLRAMRTPEQDNDFATGLSFEDLEKVTDFLSQNASSTTENKELAQKVVGTNLLEEIEKALPEASLKVARLLDEILSQTPQKESDFDIEEFV
ncbi:hypothetical protein CGC58_11705 [Capnocytophaga stomatis]|uniref:Conjugal transfer protein TraD n=1 Tax=Capnocytophaga stomatis TaxID=1848904 RepID=A0A250G1Y3_9FLAO|nr:hypothetical protein [Capnocytophaga stomatis]ATA90338.1 hypothetical protein CGC58_11705 [Capnocytophaga stomatis]